MIEIKPQNIINTTVTVPGSKSYTHRILIASALSDGPCTVRNMLRSEDTLLTLATLKQMGVRAEEKEDRLILHGTGGRLSACDEIYLANSGTSMRLLTAVAALAEGTTVLTGTERMQERPISDLLDALNQMDVPARSLTGSGCPPVEVRGGNLNGGSVALKCGISSQYLSGMLLIAPYTRNGLEIKIVEGPVSKPYVDMTVEVMQRLGVTVERSEYDLFFVPGNQLYRAGDYTVEADVSNASYFWAAAAVTGGTVRVRGISADSGQGDIRLLDCLERMGCRVIREKSGITVIGGPLSAIDADMADMPDMVPTLAVVAAFAEGTTEIRNVAHLKAKECDRLAAVATELSKMGIDARCTESGLIITGGKPHGAEIDTYDDHRIAMCFSVAGLKVSDIFIKDEMCVKKSFPNYWEVFETLYG
ncbi:3-phosphoshikimate 1-carboxyvinyltransferase [Desulfonema ishimotonii]|uniref:3-phosphoshikimate 1-carboxyvinyltransferase n=1 Tax=Desulfonema ishimotonii TaxID=45657 RepID=A0A401FWT4_9BACT|nr:3-phosphoshikimate 1-carboxyvinyltransferase [Desulfonema ishimotonii]GBC61430.1 3-phosphoshikimate 1-carboxyvinyltransferase [Desulfonema ishimotonii]